MADGCRLAVDVILPNGDATRRWPTVLILTPYIRRFRLKPGVNDVEPSPNSYRYRDMFVPRGYAVVVVDARGTGASFGTRDSFRSPRERADYKTIADWVVAQQWSDGTIGATGISYLGAACDFLASTGHKAVKAIAPLFAVWDTWADNYYPGGMLIKRLALTYDELMLALDHDRADLRAKFSYFANPALLGPMPVDDDQDGALAREAVKGHLANFRMPDFITEFKCRDDALPYDPGFTSASFSPYNYLDDIPKEVAVYAISGWMDGAGYANGAISRFLTLPNAERRVLLGPWDHGARVNASPWRARQEPEFPVLGEVLRFFDQHLCGRDTGLAQEEPIHYFAVHAEQWRAAEAWPPVAGSRTFYTAPGKTLAALHPDGGSSDWFVAAFAAGSGTQTRYERIAGIDATNYYDDWQGREAKLLSFTTPPLDEVRPEHAKSPMHTSNAAARIIDGHDTPRAMTPKALQRLALSFPETHEEPHFERTSFRVKKKIFATMTPDGKEAMVRVASPELVASLLATHPEAFFSYGTWTTRNGSLGVRLAKANAELLGELVREAWRSVAPKRVRAAYDAARPKKT